MAEIAAEAGHRELVQWLCGEGGFAMDEDFMTIAAFSGNLELVKWLRVNGCPWHAAVRDWVSEKFGYADNLGNVTQ